MNGRWLSYWLFSLRCRWFPERVRPRRQPIVRYALPTLGVLEDRLPAGSLLSITSSESALCPEIAQRESRLSSPSDEGRTESAAAGVTATESLWLLAPSSATKAEDFPVHTNTPPQAEPAPQQPRSDDGLTLAKDPFGHPANPPRQANPLRPQDYSNPANLAGAGTGPGAYPHPTWAAPLRAAEAAGPTLPTPISSSAWI